MSNDAQTDKTHGPRTLQGPLHDALSAVADLRKRTTLPEGDLSSMSHRGVSTVVLEPATKAQILTQLAKLDAAFPSAAMTGTDRDLRYEVFCQALAGFTAAAVRHAADTYIASPPAKKGEKKFFPEPHELIAECGEHQRLAVLRERGKARPANAGPL